MTQKTLSILLRVLVVLLGLFVGFLYFPFFARLLIDNFEAWPEMAVIEIPSFCFVYATAIPVYTSFVLFWCICADIGRDRSFTSGNAKRLTWIGLMSLLDTLIVMALILFLGTWNAINFGALFILGLIVLIGLAIAAAAFTLSHLVGKAAALQQDADLTV